MTEEKLLFVYVLTLLAGLAGLVIYRELRRRQFAPSHAQDNLFRCSQCSYVYTDDPDVVRSRCPQCGTRNDVYRF